MIVTGRPGSDEYDPAFAGYVARISGEEAIVPVLGEQLEQVAQRFEGLPEARGDHRYAPGKWSIKEVVGHLSDTERVFAYRALRIGRGDSTPLLGFDDQAYVKHMRAGDRSLKEMTAEWEAVRLGTLALFRGFGTPAWQRRALANGQPVSVRALAYIIAGHTRHHMETLDARYGE